MEDAPDEDAGYAAGRLLLAFGASRDALAYRMAQDAIDLRK